MSAICRNCKYFAPNHSWYSTDSAVKYGYCRHEKSTTIDLVSGRKTYGSAESMREYDNLCGKDGKFFVDEPSSVKKYVRELSRKEITNIFFCFMIIVVIVFATPVK